MFRMIMKERSIYLLLYPQLTLSDLKCATLRIKLRLRATLSFKYDLSFEHSD